MLWPSFIVQHLQSFGHARCDDLPGILEHSAYHGGLKVARAEGWCGFGNGRVMSFMTPSDQETLTNQKTQGSMGELHPKFYTLYCCHDAIADEENMHLLQRKGPRS